jgi:hypothetical protein
MIPVVYFQSESEPHDDVHSRRRPAGVPILPLCNIHSDPLPYLVGIARNVAPLGASPPFEHRHGVLIRSESRRLG